MFWKRQKNEIGVGTTKGNLIEVEAPRGQPHSHPLFLFQYQDSGTTHLIGYDMSSAVGSLKGALEKMCNKSKASFMPLAESLNGNVVVVDQYSTVEDALALHAKGFQSVPDAIAGLREMRSQQIQAKVADAEPSVGSTGTGHADAIAARRAAAASKDRTPE